MNLSSPFIRRPIATSLLAIAIIVLGVLSYFLLPVAPLPQMTIPMISVQAQLSGASAEMMASSVATPLERSLGSISGLNSMSSNNTEGRTRIFLEFDLTKDIHEASQEVQAAINAARPLLPSNMRTPPSYRKLNPNAIPIMALALTSETHDQGQLYDLASSLLSQRLSQVKGVGEVSLGGSSLPAVRVDLNPYQVGAYGLSFSEIRQAIAQANTLSPVGILENDQYHWQLKTNGALRKASDFRELIIRWKDNKALRLKDIAHVYDYIESEFNNGFYNQDKAINILIRREESANIIQTISAIKENLPHLQALLPETVQLTIAQDRSPSIKATLVEAEFALIMAILLVVFVVWVFLGNWQITLIAAVSVPVSLLGTFMAIYLLGYSLNTISLMALIVTTGFVVDDAIVVLENIVRYVEKGDSPYQAALRGSKEVAFTVISMSLSLIAVFFPLLMMNNMIGVLFKEFAMTLSISILISLVISLSLIPSLCARYAKGAKVRKSFFYRFMECLQKRYEKSLQFALAHRFFTLSLFILTVVLNIVLFVTIPKGTFPSQDTGLVMGFFRVDQGTSFQAMLPKLEVYRQILVKDPNVQTVMGYAGGRGGNTNSFLIIQLKPIGERQLSAQEVIGNLRKKFSNVAGAQLSLVVQQDIRMGGAQASASSGEYELIIKANDLGVLREWVPKIQQKLSNLPELREVMQSTQDRARRIELALDRDAIQRLGVDIGVLTNTLGGLFGSHYASVLYDDLNQYYVVMSLAKEFTQDPQILEELVLIGESGQKIPLSALVSLREGLSPSSVRHQGLAVSDTISYNLVPTVSLSQAQQAIDMAIEQLNIPQKSLQLEGGSDSKLLEHSKQLQPLLILMALGIMYIVLGILYESFSLPLVILSTLPSAGVGALIALRLVNMEFTLIALIAFFLLIGIVKKNAIMMVDFAISRERAQKETPEKAIFEACMVRFRPILMTSFSAIFGAIPLIVATGAGVEMRQPLGVTIVGGLLLSQLITLYSTPVIYVLLHQLKRRIKG